MSDFRLTEEELLSQIDHVDYILLPNGRTTLCNIRLKSGFELRPGFSSCLDAENFRLDLGKEYSFKDAIRQLWDLEGYVAMCYPETVNRDKTKKPLIDFTENVINLQKRQHQD
ncbi:hypothetical protein [Ralstonia phage RSP15]|uniref:hypothetical protein n=1 Tax=Ralstonia phage RSP15 TaxID=1785960 RepID=UPI00074D2B2F|nr:hypothetical protein BH754_gp119 [Ralstonia phage RSP15]BAU40187.1 hypothetical protein [Ralstonia phage RSP15]